MRCVVAMRRRNKSRERISYSGLGSRIAQLLRLAEEQSEQILAIARTEAVGQASVMAALSANRDCVPWLRAC